MSATTTLTALRAIVRSRGYSGTDDELDRWINTAERIVVGHQLWPFRRDFETGNSPLTIARLGPVAQVALYPDGVIGLKLEYEPFHDDLSFRAEDVPSTPTTYLVRGNVVEAYSSQATQLCLFHYQIPAVLDSGSDISMVPDECIDVLTDCACREGAKHAREWGEVAALAVEVNAGLERMEDELLRGSIEPFYASPGGA